MSILQKTILIFFLLTLCGCAGRERIKVQVDKTGPNIEVDKNKEVSELDMILPQLMLPYNKENTPEYIENGYILDANKVIELEISRKGYTRFSIEEERITDVFIYPQEAVQTRIHNQGYLIIVPEPEYQTANEKIYVTITGEQGATQDLSLHFTGKAPSPVKFIKPTSEQNFEKLPNQENKKMFYKAGILRSQPSLTVTAFVSLALLILICMFPEICLAADPSVEGQLTKVGDLADNKLKKIFVSVAVILGGAWAAVNGNIKLVLGICGCAVCLGLIIEWIKGGMVFAV